MLATREQIYATVRREPLGKPYTRGFQLPVSTDSRGPIFGKACGDGGVAGDNRGGFAAKGALYPSVEASDEQFREQYVQTLSSASYAVSLACSVV